MQYFAFLFTVTFLGCAPALLGCVPEAKAPSPNPAVVPDSDLCNQMCDHLAVLGCEEGKPVYDSDRPGPKGVPNMTCTEFCLDQQSKGTFINPRCVIRVHKCSEIESARQNVCTP
jgi:hypothetical protein